MKIQNLAIIGLAVTLMVFGLVTVNVGRFFYKQHNDSVAYMNQQNKAVAARLAATEESMRNLTAAIEGMNSRLNNYDKSFLAVKEKIDSVDNQRRDMTAQLDKTHREFAEWQKHYMGVLKELNLWAENVRVNIEEMKKDMSKKAIEEVKKVDLGKIICGNSK